MAVGNCHVVYRKTGMVEGLHNPEMALKDYCLSLRRRLNETERRTLKMALTENRSHWMEQNLLLHNCDLMMNETWEPRMYQEALLQTAPLSVNRQPKNLRNHLEQEVGTDCDEKKRNLA
jgi:hypothetical protein